MECGKVGGGRCEKVWEGRCEKVREGGVGREVWEDGQR